MCVYYLFFVLTFTIVEICNNTITFDSKTLCCESRNELCAKTVQIE